MTCIVALRNDDHIYMGSDSAGVCDEDMTIVTRLDKKVFTRSFGEADEQMIFGFCGSFRIGQLLRYTFIIPIHHKQKSDVEYIVTDFVSHFKNMLKSNGALSIDKDTQTEEQDGSLLIGYRDQLFLIEEDFQVGLPAENYSSVGMGSQVAQGAMYATENLVLPFSPKDRIEIALNASALFCAGVRGPFTILNIKNVS